MEPILFVDLDESLIKTDILREQLVRSFATSPWETLKLIFRQKFRPERVKAAMVGNVDSDPVTLPYNAEVLALIHQAKKEGRLVVLATATHEYVAQKIANHLGVFDAVLATTDTHNCKGANKLAAMQNFAAGRPFGYVGDSQADLVIFKAAQTPYIVGGLSYPHPHHRISRPSILKPFLRAIRPHEWAKNGLIFLPLLASLPLTWPAVLRGMVGFICFSWVTSAASVISGMANGEDDRHHPEKKERPFAKGDLTIDEGVGLALALLAATILLSCFLAPAEFWVLGGYLALAFLHSFSVKTRPVLDAFWFSALYTVPVLYGQVLNGIGSPVWLVAFGIFFLSGVVLRKPGN